MRTRDALALAVCCSSGVLAWTGRADAADVKRGWGGGSVDYANYTNSRWYYHWGPGAAAGFTPAEFVPMIWGNGNFTNDLNTAKAQVGAQYLMGFNEPERTDQANMSVATAISRWPAMMTANLKLVSPAVSDTTTGRAWIADFMAQANANNYRVDAVAFHWYGTVDPANPEGSASGFLSRVDSYYNLYQRPIWITEWGGIDWGGAHSTETMNEANRRFLIRAIAGLESRAYVQRYAWWNWSDDTRVYVNGATPFTPSIVGNEYIPALLPGETKDIAGASQGYDNFYLRGGQLTNNGAAQSSAVRYIDAIDGTSTISGTGNWTVYGDTVRLRNGATLQKTGTNQISFNGVALANEGTILVNGGTLILQNGPTLSGRGMFRVDAGTLALGAVGDTSTMLLGQPVELRGGMLASNSGVQNLSAPVTLFNSSVINTTAGTLMVNGTIIGAGNLTFEGAGTTRLANTNSYTGDTYIDAGTQGVAVVRATRSNPFGATGTVYFNPAGNGTRGRIEVQDNITVPNNIVLSARDIASVSIENIGGSNTFSGTLSAQVGGSYYVIQSDAGLLTFSGAASGAGGVAMKSLATGQRTFTLQGAGDGLVSGVIENGSGTVNLLKQGAGTWTLANANTYTGATTVKAGTLKLENSLTSSAAIQVDGGTLELASDGSNLRVISTPALTIGATGRLDLADNKLFTNVPAGTFTGGAYTGVQGEVARAYNFGAWDQPGLMTSEGLAGPNAGGLSGTTTIGVATGEQILFLGLNDTAVFAGQTITGATTVAMYTYAGDLNFDGLVDAADYGVIDNWAQFAGTDGYANGDINYDGVIDAADYGIIDNTIQLQGPPIAVAGAGLLKVTAVPEPASLAVISGALALFGGRCRRRHVN